jgi:hypothetical protein
VSILRRLDKGKRLSESEVDWLKQHGLTETMEIAAELERTWHFAALKVQYQVTQYQDSSPSSHLYKILVRLDTGAPLPESDVNWLTKRDLTVQLRSPSQSTLPL